MFNSQQEFLADVDFRLQECIRTHQKDTIVKGHAFKKLALGKWMYFFKPASVTPLRDLCRSLSSHFYTQHPRSKAAALLYRTCNSHNFDVVCLPRLAQQVTYSEKFGLQMTPLRDVAHAGLMVPYRIDYKNMVSGYRKMMIRVDLLTPNLFLHELAHAMEKRRVIYTRRNHDNKFKMYFYALKAFWVRFDYQLPMLNHRFDYKLPM